MRINKKPVKETIYKDEAYHHRWIIPGKSYLWGVSSVDKSYNESQKVWIKGYIPDDEPPLTPKSIYARSQEDGSIKITWQICLSWDAAGYKLYRGQDTQKAPILLKEFATQTLSYIDKDINKGTRYFYYVSAVDKAGNESKPSDKVYVVAADIHSPPAPENLKAIYIEKKRYVLITWDKLKEIDDLAGYNVYYCHLPTGMYKQLNKELIKEEKFIHKECKQEGLYYKVRAMDTSGNLSRYSKFTQAIKKEE
jgi:predicted phage tail protein